MKLILCGSLLLVCLVCSSLAEGCHENRKCVARTECGEEFIFPDCNCATDNEVCCLERQPPECRGVGGSCIINCEAKPENLRQQKDCPVGFKCCIFV